MTWTVFFHPVFDNDEFPRLPVEVQDELLARVGVIEEFGPRLGRPTVDTLIGSRFQNLKEIRFNCAGGVWRFAFAFDPQRSAIVLCGGDKQGTSSKKFYRDLIHLAESRFADHLKATKATTKKS